MGVRRWSVRILLAAVVVLAGTVSGITGRLWVNTLGTPSADARTRQGDALWLGHAWVDGRKGPADVAALARQLGGGVRYLFVHTGPLNNDGSLDPALYPEAPWLIGALHRAIPGVQVLAWLGDTVDSEGPGMDLASAHGIIGSFTRVLDAGFDGVHVDLEPIHSGDRTFLDILAGAHSLTTKRHRMLSVSVPQTEPLPAIHLLAGLVSGHPKWWSSGYLTQVAERVDQVAVMAYDTGMPTQTLFTGYMEQQTELALAAVPPSVDLVIGLPAYYEDKPGHRGSAETVAAAIRGVRLADRGRIDFGVAVYVDFTATPQDWSSYHHDWAP